jgi:hypothetical protein
MNGIYLFSLSYTDPSLPRDPSSIEVNKNASSALSSLIEENVPLQVRSGYLGMCITSGLGWICSRSSLQLASILRQSEAGTQGDPLNLIYAAEKFRSEVVFVGLM